MTARPLHALGLALALLAGPLPAADVSLDYDFYKARVEPIFLTKREGHARCFVCHSDANNAFRLQHMAAKAGNWSEEQSRKNFAMWKLFVKPGDPAHSRLLTHPLAESAGGDRFHAGGKHWKSQSEPEWQTLATWVRGGQ